MVSKSTAAQERYFHISRVISVVSRLHNEAFHIWRVENLERGVWITLKSIHHAPDSIHHAPISYTTLQKCYMKISNSVIWNAELCNMLI